jgi:hypothetical protein
LACAVWGPLIGGESSVAGNSGGRDLFTSTMKWWLTMRAR